MKRTSPEFKKLQKRWYDKLKDEGFEDIEDVENDTLKSFCLGQARVGTPTQFGNSERKDKQASRSVNNALYFRACRQLMNTAEFETVTKGNATHRKMWEMYANGASFRVIGEAFNVHTQSARYFINKIRVLCKISPTLRNWHTEKVDHKKNFERMCIDWPMHKEVWDMRQRGDSAKTIALFWKIHMNTVHQILRKIRRFRAAYPELAIQYREASVILRKPKL